MYSKFGKDNKRQDYPHLYQICAICIFIFVILMCSVVRLIDFFSTRSYPYTLQIYSVYQSAYLSADKEIVLNVYNHSLHRIYIDIGCFNGETIEHFIRFIPNSKTYDIITFEPDPFNYQLCKERLTQEKYRDYNIIIIPRVVWIRNEKLPYQIGIGQRSRIDSSKQSFTHLSAIDFPSWLNQIIPSNRTKLHIKISATGTELILLEKMIADGTLSIADKWDVQWTDQSNRRTQPVRFYIELMFDTFGYDWIYVTSLSDRRQVFQTNGSYVNVTKYRVMSKAAQPETFVHYVQRPEVADRRGRTLKGRKLKKISE